jgi:hypothetical protein
MAIVREVRHWTRLKSSCGQFTCSQTTSFNYILSSSSPLPPGRSSSLLARDLTTRIFIASLSVLDFISCSCSCWWDKTSLNCGHQRAYCSSPQMICEYGEPQWNDTDRGKPKNLEKNLSQCDSIPNKSHMDWPWGDPGPPRWEAWHRPSLKNNFVVENPTSPKLYIITFVICIHVTPSLDTFNKMNA